MLQIHADLSATRADLDALSKTLRELRDQRAGVTIRDSDGRTQTFTGPQARQELDKLRRGLTALDAQRTLYAERINRTVVQHEVTHQVFFNAGVHVPGAINPKWLVEGLACLFETPPDQGSSASGFTAINQLRLADFRAAVAGDRPNTVKLTGRDFADAIHAGRFTHPQKLVSDPAVFDQRGDRGAANYALAWALVQYLQRDQPAKLAAYIKELATRPPGASPTPEKELALLKKHFGPLDALLITRCGEYTLRLPVRSIVNAR
jgi:hypothetical protein